MGDYNYKKAIKADVKKFLKEEYQDVSSEDINELFEILSSENSITGGDSGSYTYCRQTAKEYVLSKENVKLARAAYIELDSEEGLKKLANDICNNNWETIDMLIRIHLLYDILQEVLNEL